MSDSIHITPPEDGEDVVQPWAELEVTEEQYKKYWNEDDSTYDWKSHAKEAEFKASQAKDKGGEAPKDKSEAEKAAKDFDEGAAKAAVEKAGLDWDELGVELISEGGLTDASRKALNDNGITDEVIDNYQAGAEAIAILQFVEIMDQLGGDDGLEEIKGLVKTAGWSQEKRTQVENDLSDPKAWKGAVQELVDLRKSASSSAKDDDEPASENEDGVVGYKNQDELVAAMQNPLYRDKGPKGRAYRAEVEAKARASTYNMNPRSHTVGF